MNISFDSTGKILAACTDPIANSIVYSAALPTDFMATFGVGKYVMTNGAIIAVSGWVAPPVPTLPI